MAVSLLLSYCKTRTRGTCCDFPYETYLSWVIIVIFLMTNTVFGIREQVFEPIDGGVFSDRGNLKTESPFIG